MFKNILVLLNFYKPHVCTTEVYDSVVDHNLQFRKMAPHNGDFTLVKSVRH